MPRLSLTILITTLAATIVASNYVLQPVLPAIARSFPGSPWIGAWAAGMQPVGYALGLFLLVPLGDRYPLRSMVLIQSAILVGMLVVAAFCRAGGAFLGALLIAGMTSTAAAHCIALAGRLQSDREGRAVGTVVMGVSIGMLMGRFLAGVLAACLGWRAPMTLLAVLIAAVAATAWVLLPRLPAAGARIALRDVITNVPQMLTMNRDLRCATFAGGLWFTAFSMFWTALALHLAQPPFNRGPAFAGAFGLIGIVGAVVARGAGAASDRWGAYRTIFSALWVALAGFVTLAACRDSLLALGIGTLLMDAGCFAAHSATQADILRRAGADRSRRYGAYMAFYWSAGAVGACVAPAFFAVAGWTLLNGVNVCLIGAALLMHAQHDARRDLASG